MVADIAYKEGYDKGHTSGYLDGQSVGFADGKSAGFIMGFEMKKQLRYVNMLSGFVLGAVTVLIAAGTTGAKLNHIDDVLSNEIE